MEKNETKQTKIGFLVELAEKVMIFNEVK